MDQQEDRYRRDEWERDPQNPYAAPQTALPERESLVTRSDQQLNPWLSIWTQPRATIRQIVDTDPTYLVVPLAALGGIGHALDRASMRNAGDTLPLAGILVLALVVGPLGGLLSVYVGGALIRLTGTWLGGVAQPQQMRAALAWGQVPSIWASLLWLPELAIFGAEMFTSDTPRMDSQPVLGFLLLGFAGMEMVIGVWQIFVALKCIGEVHEFSAWRALGAVLLAGLVVVAVVAIPVALILLLASAA
jgi:hypothetical protein